MAAVRLPTPRGPKNRYACAGPSAIAARRSRLASACSGKFSKTSTNLLCDLGGGTGAIHGHDPVREHRRELTVRAVDGSVEVQALALDSIRRAAAGERDFG